VGAALIIDRFTALTETTIRESNQETGSGWKKIEGKREIAGR
jgi:hypothetical protein